MGGGGEFAARECGWATFAIAGTIEGYVGSPCRAARSLLPRHPPMLRAAFLHAAGRGNNECVCLLSRLRCGTVRGGGDLLPGNEQSLSRRRNRQAGAVAGISRMLSQAICQTSECPSRALGE